jgi:hypothetical protein
MERKSLIQLSALGWQLPALGSWLLATELEFSGCLTLAGWIGGIIKVWRAQQKPAVAIANTSKEIKLRTESEEES